MKRKVIKLANKTLVVSLPAKWVKKVNLKKGEEINIEENERNLIISTDSIVSFDKTEIDISEIDERSAIWVLSALHKKGYDEIRVIYEGKNQFSIIQGLMKDLFIGFVIIRQDKSSCTLRAIAKDSDEEFDNILRRAFIVTLSMGESLLEMIKNKNFGDMEELISLEHTNNQLTNFCERLLHKKGHKDQKKNFFLYTITWNLEKVCDNYKYIIEFLTKNKNSKISKETIQLFEESNKLLRGYYDLFYKFKLKTLSQLSNDSKNLLKNLKEKIQYTHKEESIILNYLLNHIMQIRDFSASFTAINQS